MQCWVKKLYAHIRCAEKTEIINETNTQFIKLNVIFSIDSSAGICLHQCSALSLLKMLCYFDLFFLLTILVCSTAVVLSLEEFFGKNKRWNWKMPQNWIRLGIRCRRAQFSESISSYFGCVWWYRMSDASIKRDQMRNFFSTTIAKYCDCTSNSCRVINQWVTPLEFFPLSNKT